MFQKTKRQYRNVENGEIFAMYHDSTTGKNMLLNEDTGAKITSFYACAFTSIDLKTKDGKTIRLNAGEFTTCSPIAKKIFFQKRFTKIK